MDNKNYVSAENSGFYNNLFRNINNYNSNNQNYKNSSNSSIPNNFFDNEFENQNSNSDFEKNFNNIKNNFKQNTNNNFQNAFFSNSSESTPNIDFSTILKIKNLMDKLNQNNQNPRSNLLISLKPYLSKNKKEKLDEYIKIFNIADIFENLNNGGE